MMKNTLAGIILYLLPLLGFNQTPSLQTFPLSAVRLLNSPFKQAQETDMKYMLALDVDRLLAPFLKEAGLEPRAANYGNWEGTGLGGHIGGHYLSALSNMYAATGNNVLLQRLDYMLDWLGKCQQKNGDGYVGGIPGGKEMWNDIAQGKIRAASFSLNDKWVPWYNMHKLYAGLCDAYLIAGNVKARDILVKLSDWCLKITSGLSDEQMQRMLRCEQGGMNEVFANVAAITGDMKYVVLARRFSDRKILNPLLLEKDSLNGLHANTQIPKVIGYMRIAEVAGDLALFNAARFFWQTVVDNRTVSIGGNSVREHFNPAANFSSMIESNQGPETCNTYNMLKLTSHLFLSNASVNYMDYYERALYNHILSSQHPDGGFVYFTPMRPRHYRVYSQPDQDFWCCVGSGLENHGKYGELIYAHNDKDIFINLFIPSTLEWKEKGITLTQNTTFPFEETSRIKLQLKQPAKFTVYVRYPSWVLKGKMKLKVNNKEIPITSGSSSYIPINREWKPGDIISVLLPMQTTAEFLPDHSSWVSFVHGPVVLAAATDTSDLTGLFADSSRMGHVAGGPLYPIEEAPLIVTLPGNNIASAIVPVKGEPLTFTASRLIYPAKYKNLKLVPFFQVHDARYMLYWAVTSPEKLATAGQASQEVEKNKMALEAGTIDQVAPGEQQPEADHNFQGENTETGVFNDRHWRHAAGWFSYELRNKNKDARTLRVTYYGMDNNRNFDIYINNTLLKNVRLNGSAGDTFVDVDYALPVEISRANEILKIKFVASAGSIAGGIYYIRLLK